MYVLLHITAFASFRVLAGELHHAADQEEEEPRGVLIYRFYYHFNNRRSMCLHKFSRLLNF